MLTLIKKIMSVTLVVSIVMLVVLGLIGVNLFMNDFIEFLLRVFSTIMVTILVIATMYHSFEWYVEIFRERRKNK